MNPPALAPSECADAFAARQAQEFRDGRPRSRPLLSRLPRRIPESGGFLLREIARGKLVARRHVGAGRRITYRIEPEDWAGYLATCWPKTPGPSSRTDHSSDRRTASRGRPLIPARHHGRPLQPETPELAVFSSAMPACSGSPCGTAPTAPRTSTDQVLAEIKAGRLRAGVRHRDSGRSTYRVRGIRLRGLRGRLLAATGRAAA